MRLVTTAKCPNHWHMGICARRGVAGHTYVMSMRANRRSTPIERTDPGIKRPASKNRDGQNAENMGTLRPKAWRENAPNHPNDRIHPPNPATNALNPGRGNGQFGAETAHGRNPRQNALLKPYVFTRARMTNTFAPFIGRKRAIAGPTGRSGDETAWTAKRPRIKRPKHRHAMPICVQRNHRFCLPCSKRLGRSIVRRPGSGAQKRQN